MTTTRLLPFPAPIGSLRASATTEGIVGLWFTDGVTDGSSRAPDSVPPFSSIPPPDRDLTADLAALHHLEQLDAELNAYLEGRLHRFTVPLRPSGSPFQRQVWEALLTVPYGRTCSYAALTEQLGFPSTSARALGQANGQNPIAILIPCHRVVQRGGGLGGYGGGLERKAWLLAHERRHAPPDDQPADPAETWSGQLRLGM
jgi:O-6-methylguanine DNA methyltransferase